MTLIAAFVAGPDFAAISDLAATVSGSNRHVRTERFPVNAGIRSGHPSFVSGLVQKNYVSPNDLLMFAGNSLEAHVFLERFKRRPIEVNESSTEFMQRELQSILRTDNQTLQVIGASIRDGQIEIRGFGCEKALLPDVSIVAAGSGLNEALWPMRPARGEENSGPRTFGQAIQTLSYLIAKEHLDPTHHSERFGCGYELIIYDPKVGFKKIPYVLDQYRIFDDGTVGWISRTVQRYDGDQLNVVMLCKDTTSEIDNGFITTAIAIKPLGSIAGPKGIDLSNALRSDGLFHVNHFIGDNGKFFGISAGKGPVNLVFNPPDGDLEPGCAATMHVSTENVEWRKKLGRQYLRFAQRQRKLRKQRL